MAGRVEPKEIVRRYRTVRHAEDARHDLAVRDALARAVAPHGLVADADLAAEVGGFDVPVSEKIEEFHAVAKTPERCFCQARKNTVLEYRQNGVFVEEFCMDDEANVLMTMRLGANMTRVRLAELAGTSPQQIEKLEKGIREMTRPWAERLAPHLGVSPEFLVFSKKRRSLVVGYAAAGGDGLTFADGQGPFEEVDAPLWATDRTVAVRIRGNSLGVHFNGWLAFYDDRRDPPDESLIGLLCICGLADGRVVIKTMRQGTGKRRYHLESITEPTMFDVEVEWAAEVREMRPR